MCSSAPATARVSIAATAETRRAVPFPVPAISRGSAASPVGVTVSTVAGHGCQRPAGRAPRGARPGDVALFRPRRLVQLIDCGTTRIHLSQAATYETLAAAGRLDANAIIWCDQLAVELREFTREQLWIVAPWFADPETRRFLGGPEWPEEMLERGDRVVGEEFRGAVQTGAYRYLAHAGGRPVGYVDCGTFDRCTVYGGESPRGPSITDSIEVATGSIAFVVDPDLRRRGLGRAMIGALLRQAELLSIILFEAGVEPDNVASLRCLGAAGFRLGSDQPDWEGMLYYRARRADIDCRPASGTRA